jgi:lipopolysaccharide transport system ATP-binding protein
MSNNTVLKVENLSKVYRLGEVGTGTISHDLNRWWAKMRGKEDPFSKVGHVNDRTQKAQKGEYVNALADINFEVKKGEVLGIIGKNGAGKSTLLKIISRITAPTTGRIMAKGRVASLLEVGTGMHPEMTGRENVYLNGTILGMTRREIDQKFDEIVDFAGCAKYADTPVKRYSSGMKVRLGFAVAAFLEPEILIVDEVLAVGDAEFQKKAIGKMQDISSGGGRTVLFVSHNMASVQKLCGRVLLLENGNLKINGDTDSTVRHYLQRNKDLVFRAPLFDRKDRKGNGIIMLQDLEILDVHRKPLTSIVSGMDVIIRVKLEARANLNNVIIRIQIANELGENVFTCNNYHSSKYFSFNSGVHNVNCIIPKFPLTSGIYFIHLHSFTEKGLADEIEYTYKLLINDGDFFGSGKLPMQKDKILVKHTWEIK